MITLPGREVLDDPDRIARSIESTPDTPRACNTEHPLLVELRDQVTKHIKNTYLRQLDVPIDAPKPRLICWMELNQPS